MKARTLSVAYAALRATDANSTKVYSQLQMRLAYARIRETYTEAI
jgi:hypothetical protein